MTRLRLPKGMGLMLHDEWLDEAAYIMDVGLQAGMELRIERLGSHEQGHRDVHATGHKYGSARNIPEASPKARELNGEHLLREINSSKKR